ncbi:MAG: GtrA family protein [Chloroflexi bacterium]|nr:GtrA family protein [Chloroflexota bacterium]
MIARLIARADLSRLVRFGLVGLSGTLVNLAVVHVLFGTLHWPAVIASPVAVEVSVVNNFLWNNWWTFRQRSISLARFIRFNLASLGGLAITAAIFAALVDLLGWHYLLADLIAIGAATGWNFAASVLWTWAR